MLGIMAVSAATTWADFPIAAISAANRSPAGLAPAAIFSDHMVLQRQAKVPVWGTTAPGGTVTVNFMGQTKTAAVDDQGKWMVRLDEMEAVSESQEMTVKDAKETRIFKDVLVGEVWLGSGQSNMEFGWTFSDECKAKRAIRDNVPEKAKDPDYMGGCVDEQTMEVLRRAIGNPMIRVSSKTRDHLTTPNTGWSRVTEENVRTLPALPGCIAVYLQKEIQVPVGIIVRAVSGTAACRWISESAYINDPLVKKQIEVFKSQGGKPGLVGVGNRFGDLYADYVSPVVPYAIRGFLWDQGEWRTGVRISNELVGRTGQCSISDWTPMMHALVTSWREAWGQGDLPWSATDHYPDELEEDLRKAGLAHFAIAKTDGLSRALHPLNKWKYAQRHLDNILPMAYSRESPYHP
jgi:sialate O-acetylesterase